MKIVGCTLGFVLCAAHFAVADEIAGTFPVDPVELVRGSEVAGDDAISATHFRFRYVFANEDNKAEFLAHPEKYEIQLGGACARMGALSGVCSLDRYAVHQGKIYLFASDACRSTFLKNPERCLDQPDVIREASEENRKRGMELIEKAVEAMGGAARIDAVTNYQYRETSVSEDQGQKVQVTDTTTLVFPDKLRTDYTWGDSKYSTVVTASDGWNETPTESFKLHEQQRTAAIKHYLGHNLLAILKARHQPGFTAAYAEAVLPANDPEGAPIVMVTVHCYGATSKLGIDPDTDLVRFHSFRGQGPNMTYGQVERIYKDYADVDGIKLPKSYDYSFDGEKVEQTDAPEKSVMLSSDIDDRMFRYPSSQGRVD